METRWKRVLVAVGFLLIHQTAASGETNLVSKKLPTNQSSNYTDRHNEINYAKRAIDGDEGTCAHTKEEPNSWWMIDLQGLFQISSISINNKNNKRSNLNDSEIYIGNSTEQNGTNNTLCATASKSLNNESQNLTCKPSIWGRYVSVNAKKKVHMILCEVEIYGIKQKRWKLVTKRKTWEDALYYCRARDMDLVSVLDEETQNFVELVARNAKTPNVWLGLHYTCTLGFWFWVADELMDYSNWDPGYNSHMSMCDKSAVMAEDGRWVPKSVYEEFNFICEESLVSRLD